ncbi:MAG: hypothetical protein FJ271_08720 [Planctomycetes bacterium]|nr:hypothetical protein [Planctomycetota bacterium]
MSSPTKELFGDQGYDFSDQEVSPGSATGQVFRIRGTSSPRKEVEVGDAIQARFGRAIVLAPTKNQPGIDGVYQAEDRAVSLKNVTGAKPHNQPRQVVERANEAYAQAKATGFVDVDVYVLATATTTLAVARRWSAVAVMPPLSPMPGGFVRTIAVICSDGVIAFSPP